VISNFRKAIRAEKDIDIRKNFPYCKPGSKQITADMKRNHKCGDSKRQMVNSC
jgi:hypothetical protein